MNDAEKFVTAPDLAQRYGVTVPTIYKLMRDGLPSVKLGRARRFRISDVDAWLGTPGEVPTDAA